MITAIVIVCVLLLALFVFAAVARNRAQTRMAEVEDAKPKLARPRREEDAG